MLRLWIMVQVILQEGGITGKYSYLMMSRHLSEAIISVLKGYEIWDIGDWR